MILEPILFLALLHNSAELESQGAPIEKCEADFVAVVAGRSAQPERPVQILIGEAKTRKQIDADDARKLGKLADAIPPDVAQAFVVFAKTEGSTTDEVALAKSLNSQGRQRVILLSREELEPYLIYERSNAGLGGGPSMSGLIDMVQATNTLWP